MNIGTEPATTDHTVVDSKMCNCCNARQPLDQFRRLHKDNEYRRPECKTCHNGRENKRLAIKREAERNPAFAEALRRQKESEKRCKVCRRVKPIGEFRKRYKGGTQRHGECNECKLEDDRKQKRKKRRKTLAQWMGQLHKNRDSISEVQALVSEMTRRFGGTERLARIWKEHFDVAKQQTPGGMFLCQTLKCLAELNMTASEVKRDEQARRDQDERPDLSLMSDEALQQTILDSAAEALLHDPRMMVAIAIDQPEVVQAEFRKYGWELVPPGNDS